MYVATASPRPKRSAFDSSRGGGGECALCSPPLDPPLQLLVHIHPLNAKCMHLGLPSQGANNVVHVRAIGGGTSERSCGHELL